MPSEPIATTSNPRIASEFGEVAGKGAAFLHIHVGSAKAPDGREFSINVIAQTHQPLIYDSKHDRYWTIGWSDLVGLAKSAIDLEMESEGD